MLNAASLYKKEESIMAENLKKRTEVEPEYKWKIEDLYANDDLWKEDAAKASELIEKFRQLQGTMGKSAGQLLRVLKTQDEMEELLEKVYVYANQKYHEDTANARYQQMSGERNLSDPVCPCPEYHGGSRRCGVLCGTGTSGDPGGNIEKIHGGRIGTGPL